ncbi:Crp/Fnr family transcriptional regulator [Paenibacillus sp. strain BS8-2]
MNELLAQTLTQAMLRFTEIPEQELLYFQDQLKWKKVKKGHFLIHSGDHCEHVYFCGEGLLKMFYENEEGSEHIKSFVTGGHFFTDYRAYLTNELAFVSIQAIEDSMCASIFKAAIEQLYARHTCWERFGRKLAEALFVAKSRKEREMVELSAEERYILLLEQFPGLEQRVPQYQIAAFLAINPVSLSRIRNKLKAKL